MKTGLNVHSEYTARVMMEEIDFKNMFRKRDFTFFDHPTIQNTLFSNQGILYQMLQDHNIALNRCKELIHRIDMELQLVPTKAKQEASNQ